MSTEKKKFKGIGPGALVAAAFIGPGTVTTCTLSGASYGYTLLWAMLLSAICTLIVQEMSCRVGIVTQKGLGENLRARFKGGFGVFVAVLVVAAIFIGNCAYETGNLTGGAMGLTALVEGDTGMWQLWFVIILAAAGFLLLFIGSYKHIERVMVILVIAMSALFVITAIIVQADVLGVIKGLFIPHVPDMDNAWLYIVSLVGTTVVPYNIFLHASSAAKNWKTPEEVKSARIDSFVSIGLGGVISIAIIIAAAAAFHGTEVMPANGKDMAIQLEPLLGPAARYMFGIGLFAAGFSSTITAPLSAAFATSGILGWGSDMKAKRFRLIWIIVIAVGVVLGVTVGSSPTQVIIFAQAANAIVLPIIAILLAIVCNSKDIMGRYKNGIFGNIVAVIIIVVSVFMAVRSFNSVITSIQGLM